MTETTILVVDDEPFICRSLSFVLRKDGHRVLEARDGEEALRCIREERPDLVFLDVMMPKVDGFEVAETVRDDPDLSAVRLVLLTARGQDADRARGAAAGVDAYVTKPFSPSGILGLCRDLLARPAAARP